MLDILIINGTVIDGSGAPGYKGCVGIKDGKLVSAKGDEPAARVIDAAGKVVCPGFIDAHSHGDYVLGTENGRIFKTVQGITTELAGQCGGSRAPVSAERVEEMHSFFGYKQPLEEAKRWTTFERYLEYVSGLCLSANAKLNVGHRILRTAVMGLENRPATAQELDRMCGMLREAMQAGASGLSTGLIYVPGCYAETSEVVELAKVIAPYNGIYFTHLRNESFALVESLQEALDIGRNAGVRVNISHHKALGKDNWGKQKTTLEMIRKANEDGYHTTLDQYPFDRCMNNMTSCIPNWYFAEGTNAVSQKLRDPAFRAQLRKEMESPDTPYDNFYRNSGGWDGIYVAAAAKTPEAEGKFISEYAELVGKDPWTAYFDLMAENNCGVSGIYCAMSQDDLFDIIRSPYCVVGTDGINKSWQDKGHPRGSSTFPKAIELYVKQNKVLTLEQMIHKMTGLTAERLLVDNKGLLKEGYDADVLVLDYDNLKVHATYDDPNRKTEGIDYVIVGGKVVYQDLEFTGEYPGKFVPHTGGAK